MCCRFPQRHRDLIVRVFCLPGGTNPSLFPEPWIGEPVLTAFTSFVEDDQFCGLGKENIKSERSRY